MPIVQPRVAVIVVKSCILWQLLWYFLNSFRRWSSGMWYVVCKNTTNVSEEQTVFFFRFIRFDCHPVCASKIITIYQLHGVTYYSPVWMPQVLHAVLLARLKLWCFFWIAQKCCCNQFLIELYFQCLETNWETSCNEVIERLYSYCLTAIFDSTNGLISQSQWPRGIRHRSAAARPLRSWVQIPPGAWIFVCCECCVLSGRGICDELITRLDESYRLWCVVVCDLET
jgi:hypothetical protein